MRDIYQCIRCISPYCASDIEFLLLHYVCMYILTRIRASSMLNKYRQDVDGLLPHGFKQLEYRPTTGFLVPHITTWSLDQLPFTFKALCHNHLLIINSGIPRSCAVDLTRGLNMRHWALLSRDITFLVCDDDSCDCGGEETEAVEWRGIREREAHTGSLCLRERARGEP